MMLRTIGRLLVRHGLTLVALYLAGQLVRYPLLEGIGFVGGHTAVGGALLFPVFILVQMFVLVAMLLILRDGMAELGVVAPRPDTPAERRRAFVDALLGSVVAFIVLYLSSGLLRDDYLAYLSRVLAVRTGEIAVSTTSATGSSSAFETPAGELTVEPITIAIIVIAYVLRWLYGRYKDRLPRGFVAAAIYLEAMWTVWSALLLSQIIGAIGTWIATRQGSVWLADLRTWSSEQVALIGWIWDGIEWFLGEVGGIILQPLAWLAICGVVFGFAVKLPRPALRVRRLDRARARYEKVPGPVRRRLNDMWGQFAGRFTPLIDALVLMWRSGPALIGGYILLFTVVVAGRTWIDIGMTRAIGPLPIDTWAVIYVAVMLVAPTIVEPLRLIVVASAYDAVIGRVRGVLASPETALDPEVPAPETPPAAVITERPEAQTRPEG